MGYLLPPDCSALATVLVVQLRHHLLTSTAQGSSRWQCEEDWLWHQDATTSYDGAESAAGGSVKEDWLWRQYATLVMVAQSRRD